MANISSINGNPIVPSNRSVGTAQVASGYNLMTDDEKSKLSGVPAQGNTPFSSINGNPIVPSNRSVGTAQVASGYNLMSAADKAKLDGFGSASTYAKKATTLGGYGITDAYTTAQTDSAISNAVSGLYRYKGSVASADKLPASPATGDVYNIETASKYGAAGASVAWNGSAWDSLGEVFSITAISNTEIDGILTK